MRLPALLTMGAIAALAACAPQTQEQYVAQVRVADSGFDSSATYLGPPIRIPSRGFPVITGDAQLRSFREKATGRLVHQLYADLYYSDSHFKRFLSASFPGGATVDTTLIDHRRLSCDRDAVLWPCKFEETIGIPLSDGFLRDHASTGFRLRLDARSGDELFVTIPAHFVSGQLKAVGGQPDTAP